MDKTLAQRAQVVAAPRQPQDGPRRPQDTPGKTMRMVMMVVMMMTSTTRTTTIMMKKMGMRMRMMRMMTMVVMVMITTTMMMMMMMIRPAEFKMLLVIALPSKGYHTEFKFTLLHKLLRIAFQCESTSRYDLNVTLARPLACP